jgi:hypothetical protein
MTANPTDPLDTLLAKASEPPPAPMQSFHTTIPDTFGAEAPAARADPKLPSAPANGNSPRRWPMWLAAAAGVAACAGLLALVGPSGLTGPAAPAPAPVDLAWLDEAVPVSDADAFAEVLSGDAVLTSYASEADSQPR